MDVEDVRLAVGDLLGRPVHERLAPAPADRATADAALAAVGLPPAGLGEPLPAVLLPVWSRPTTTDGEDLPLQLHFDLKDRFGLPEGLITGCATTYSAPVHAGDVLRTVQILRSVGAERTSRLGTGRGWVVDVEHRNQHGTPVGVETWTGLGYLPAPRPPTAEGAVADAPSSGGRNSAAGGAVVDAASAAGERPERLDHQLTVAEVVAVSTAARELRPVHLDPPAARAAGLPDVILGTTGQQLWLWRALVDHLGGPPALARLDLRMRAPVTPGPLTITSAADAADVTLSIRSGGALATTVTATVLPPP